MTWVKICGITNLEDALAAVDAGADALGFVFHEKSPRNVDLKSVRQIIDKLPASGEKIGVFVDHEAGRIREIVMQAGLTAVQLHGGFSPQDVWNDPRPVIEFFGASKVIQVVPGETLKDSGFSIGEQAGKKIFAILLDSRSNGQAGGTGKTFDWEAASGAVQRLSLSVPVIVAGGLTPLNVGEAIRIFRPFGVDVASGVEARHGKKDPEKVRAFITAVREADKVH